MSSGNPHRTVMGQIGSILSLVTDKKRHVEEVTKYLERKFGFRKFRSEILEEILLEQVKWLLERLSSNPGEAEEIIHTLQPVIADPNFFTSTQTEEKLLQVVRTVTVPATTMMSTTARYLFKRDITGTAQVMISDVGEHFIKWFGSMIVDHHSSTTLASFALTRSAYDTEIFDAIGGQGKSVVSVGQIWHLMKLQRFGGLGDLLNDGNSNIFYVIDRNAKLRAVNVLWDGQGWRIYANPRDFEYWGADRRVFVLSSLLASA